MEVNGDDHLKKSKSLALKSVVERYGDKAVRSSKVWKSEEPSDDEDSDGDTNDEEITFIIKGFQHLDNKNKRFSGRRYGFIGTSSKVNKVDQKGCFKCQKHDHFIVDCPELQKDKAKKGSFQNNNFISKLKKNLMETYGKLDNDEEDGKDEEETNLALMDLPFSDT